MTLSAEHVLPPGFLWGTATAAHQVEGGNHNNWSAWEAEGGGRIFGDQVSGAACDWWGGRWAEDFDRAAGLHNNALRLSLEWSRIEPTPGQWDEEALAHYRQMVAGLRARGLMPMVTLHHFTHPVWVEERGGWRYEDTPLHFARFCKKVAEALGDHVTLWCTINEPMVYSTLSYAFGRWPPGHTSLDEALRVAVNLVRGHAEAYYAIHDVQPQAQVGFAKHQISFEADSLLALPGTRLMDWLFNEAIFGAFSRGRMLLPGSTLLRAVRLPRARHTLDWVGLQYYQRYRVRLSNDDPDFLWFKQYARPEALHGPPGWGELAPRDLTGHLKRLWKLAQRPIYITEVGVPDEDDHLRPAYLARSVRAMWDIVNGNLPVWGFFFWSLVDNFEWAEGYDPRFRFGLYGVDFATQERTERTSAQLYRAICSANALSAEAVRQYAPDAAAELFPEPRRTFV